MANCLRPVTASSASIRLRGVPTTENCARGFNCATTDLVRDTAAERVSEP